MGRNNKKEVALHDCGFFREQSSIERRTCAHLCEGWLETSLVLTPSGPAHSSEGPVDMGDEGVLSRHSISSSCIGKLVEEKKEIEISSKRVLPLSCAAPCVPSLPSTPPAGLVRCPPTPSELGEAEAEDTVLDDPHVAPLKDGKEEGELVAEMLQVSVVVVVGELGRHPAPNP